MRHDGDTAQGEARTPPRGGLSLIPQVLTVAGSDSGGGAGIQADLKAIHANGGFGLSVVTSVTAQNTRAVTASFDLPLEIIESQFRAVCEDFNISAVKTGMLSRSEIVRRVAALLREWRIENLIVDPAMISKSGFHLLHEEAIAALREDLLPLALIATPNRDEAHRLSGVEVVDAESALEAGRRILETGCRAVLIKGGHLNSPLSTDYLVTPRGLRGYSAERIPTGTTHGTGCTYSAALATWIAHGFPMEDAVARAKAYVTEAIRHGLEIGHGHGPTDHFWFLRVRGSR